MPDTPDPPLPVTLHLYLALLDRLMTERLTRVERERARQVFHDLGTGVRDGRPRRAAHAEPHRNGVPRRRRAWLEGEGDCYLRMGDERELGAWIALVLRERIDGPEQ